MPEIIQDNEQMAALDDIKKRLDEIKLINTLIQNSGYSYTLKVNRKQTVAIDTDYSRRIKSILEAQRARRIKDITSKAAKHHISLDDEDRKIMGAVSEKTFDTAVVEDAKDDAEGSTPEENAPEKPAPVIEESVEAAAKGKDSWLED